MAMLFKIPVNLKTLLRKAAEVKKLKSEKNKLHKENEIESKKERSRPWRQTRPYSCRSRSPQVEPNQKFHKI